MALILAKCVLSNFQESRRCTLERLSWCCSRLLAIEDMLEGITNNDRHDSAFDESIFDPPLYFVNWIDQTFDDLKSLTNLISLSDPDSKQYDQWKSDVSFIQFYYLYYYPCHFPVGIWDRDICMSVNSGL